MEKPRVMHLNKSPIQLLSLLEKMKQLNKSPEAISEPIDDNGDLNNSENSDSNRDTRQSLDGQIAEINCYAAGHKCIKASGGYCSGFECK